MIKNKTLLIIFGLLIIQFMFTNCKSSIVKYKNIEQIPYFLEKYNLYAPDNFKIIASEFQEIQKVDVNKLTLTLSSTKKGNHVLLIFQLRINHSKNNQESYTLTKVKDSDFIEILSENYNHSFNFSNSINYYEINKENKYSKITEIISTFKMKDSEFRSLAKKVEGIDKFRISFLSKKTIESDITNLNEFL